MLSNALDFALTYFGAIRSKVDEVISFDVARNVKSMWVFYKGYRNSYQKRHKITAIDSGYNYREFRGYALYIQNTVWVSIDGSSEEISNGVVDIDVISSSNIEYDLSLLSSIREIDFVYQLIQNTDIALIDGSLIAVFSKIRKALFDGGNELVEAKGFNIKDVLNNLLITLSLYPSKVFFISKNSTAKDVLGLVKGDIYYFERYTDGMPGYTKPVDLTNSRHIGIAVAAKTFRQSVKRVTGIDATIYMSYARFEPFSRIYRIEFVGEAGEPVEPRIKHLIDVLSQYIVSGYPYPLMRADQIARVSIGDVERIATVLGISSDPYDREPL
ncbi:MAG: DNA double-strand break repair nuclease NurA [Ignisphaera sp.]